MREQACAASIAAEDFDLPGGFREFENIALRIGCENCRRRKGRGIWRVFRGKRGPGPRWKTLQDQSK
jgi:hypothetical protein